MPDLPMSYRTGSQSSALYRTARWLRMRAVQLAKEPLCRMCKALGKVVSANTADHVEPHRGDEQKFWHGELQSLCHDCHSLKTQMEMGRKVKLGCGADGKPLDRNHHWNMLSP